MWGHQLKVKGAVEGKSCNVVLFAHILRMRAETQQIVHRASAPSMVR
jgi:hypothetical protein